jgi:hypothetical protein
MIISGWMVWYLKKMRGRPKSDHPGRKVEPTLPADAYACLSLLAKRKRLGSNPTEVARYLILRGLDDLTRRGVLPPDALKATRDD